MGAVCVGLNDSEQSGSGVDTTGQTSAQTVTGDTVAFCGAVCYGLYTTMVKYKVNLLFTPDSLYPISFSCNFE